MLNQNVSCTAFELKGIHSGTDLLSLVLINHFITVTNMCAKSYFLERANTLEQQRDE
jgi:hypothetical protein